MELRCTMIYDYKCTICNHIQTETRKLGDTTPSTCERCGNMSKRTYSPITFIPCAGMHSYTK